MTRDQLWAMYTAKNPHWLTEGATLTAAGVRKLFDTTFDVAERHGFHNGRAAAEMEAKDRDRERRWQEEDTGNPLADLFNKMRGY